MAPFPILSWLASRYNWLLLKPLVAHVLSSVLQDFDAERKVEVGRNEMHGQQVCHS